MATPPNSCLMGLSCEAHQAEVHAELIRQHGRPVADGVCGNPRIGGVRRMIISESIRKGGHCAAAGCKESPIHRFYRVPDSVLKRPIS